MRCVPSAFVLACLLACGREPPSSRSLALGEGDASSPGGPSAPERCDATDDDGDGHVDEGAGASCGLAHALAGCRAGTCRVARCEPGWADCNSVPSDGCEAAITSDDAHCGGCAVSCSAGRACRASTCVYAPVSISAGDSHACVVRTDGRGACWGPNESGQLGAGTTTSDALPQLVTGTTPFVRIAAGLRSTCGIRSGGGLACWGDGAQGQLGDGRTGTGVASSTPIALASPTDVADVSVGAEHACAVDTHGAVYCWGSNGSGQLGDGSSARRTTPTLVSTVRDAVAVGCGASHSCALIRDGSVMCWGAGNKGQLGHGTFEGSPTPVRVTGLSDVSQLSAGGFHNCARLGGGEVFCWGEGRRGQLGDGSILSRAVPVRANLPPVSQVCAGRIEPWFYDDFHSCALESTGRVLCWGDPDDGTVGDSTYPPFGPDRLVPSYVTGLVDATAIACGQRYACALRTTGSVDCWGNGPTGARTEPSGARGTAGAVPGLP